MLGPVPSTGSTTTNSNTTTSTSNATTTTTSNTTTNSNTNNQLQIDTMMKTKTKNGIESQGIPAAVARLVRLHLANLAQPSSISRSIDLCMRILSSRILPVAATDEAHIASLMHKLSQSWSAVPASPHNHSQSARLSNLLAKLADKGTLSRRWATLYFLLSTARRSAASHANAACQPIDASWIGLGHCETSNPPSTTSHSSQIPSTNTHLVPSIEHAPKASVFNSYYIPKDVIEAHRTVLSESEIIRDIIFVCQGVDGKNIRFDPSVDYYITNPDVTVQKSTRELIKKLCEVGFLYRNISRQVKLAIQSPSLALFEQSFLFTIQKELINYYRLIAVLENQQDMSEPASHTDFFAKGLTLRRLYVWLQDPLQRLRIMATLMEVCKDNKGGTLISTVYSYAVHGDPYVHQYIATLLLDISRPFYRMLKRWICDGELEDPFGEFFVSIDGVVDEVNVWREKYVLRYGMVPAFIGKTLAKKIFLIGKSINFIRSGCGDHGFLALWSKNIAGDDLQYGDLKKLEFSIDSAYQSSSSHLISVLLDKHKLMDHMVALKRYLLLGQGDFVQCLMDSLGPSLSKPASTLYRHNLTGMLESAIRSSNAQYDDADVLQRLDVRLLEASPGDSGWDVFSLDYHVDSPINTILNPPAMQTYLKLFTFLWRLKRVEHALSRGWRRQMTMPHSIRYQSDHAIRIQNCLVLRSEMMHFVNQLQHYILFEVIECSWKTLVLHVDKRAGDLDVLIGAHYRYLNDVGVKCLLVGLPGQVVMAPMLFAIFDAILAFCDVQEAVIGFAMDGVHGHVYGGHVSGTASGIDAVSNQLENQVDDSAKQFHIEIKGFLTRLGEHADPSLRLLGTRLNFNEFYQTDL